MQRSDAAGAARKRRHEAAQRYHSADSPLAKRAQPAVLVDSDGSGDGDVVFWMPMSPRGTLQSAMRQRTPSAGPGAASDSADSTDGIVRRILDARHTAAALPDASPTTNRRRTARATTGRAPGLARNGTGSSDPDGELGPAAPLDPAVELTPLAQRRARAIPRPLVQTKSEKMFDKRQLLSSLLPGGLPSGAPTPTVEELTGAVSDGSPPGLPPPPFLLPNNLLNDTQRSCTDDDLESFAGHDLEFTAIGDLGSSAERSDPACVVKDSPQPSTAPDLAASAPAAPAAVDDDDLDIEFDLGDIDLDGLLGDLDYEDGLEELMQSVDGGDASSSSAHEPSQRFRDCEKCLVLLVTQGHYTDTQAHAAAGATGARGQKVVRVYSQTAARERMLLLRGEWEPTPVAIGDYLNVVGDIGRRMLESGDVVVDSQSCDVLPILNPDILVSCTHLSDSFLCLRRAALKERIREISDGGRTIMLVGQLLHDLFQGCALQNRWDSAAVDDEIRKILPSYTEAMWECGMDEDTAYQQVSEVVPRFQEWAQLYMHAAPQAGAQYKVHRGNTAEMDTAAVAVSSILNIEENVWSPKFGLKGKVDMTVVARYTAQGALVVPFELKTGRNTENAQHRAQLVLYTLLLADRYRVDIGSGLLYYPRTGEMICVPRIDDELRGLVAMRNTMTRYLSHTGGALRQLPDMLGKEFSCKRCAYQPSCFIAHAALEAGDERSAGVAADVWEAQVAHLRPAHLAFVRDWLRLIDGEESDMLRFGAELWSMGADYREQQTGRCLAGLRMDLASTEDTREVGSFSRYRMAFVPGPDSDGSSRHPRRRSMLDSQIGVGDPVVVSADGGQYALAVGYVIALERARITVGLDRPVRGVPKPLAGFDKTTNQVFEPVLAIRAVAGARGGRSGGDGEETVVSAEVPAGAAQDVFRIDKDEMKSTMSRVRANVMRMFVAGGGNERCRRLVVDLDPPTFAPLHPNVAARVQAVQAAKRLNAGQAQVIQTVLAANDYALVLGMPGTGKTTTIAELVAVLVGLGKSVLLASYTHIAVDNILLKLADRDIPMVRLGSRSKVHPQIVRFLPSEAGLESVSQLDAHFRRARIVATTCLGVTHPVFAAREFDYCIVDEASQITLPVCLGPLLEARRFVLVGDHHQLPPLVRNAGARDGGLGTSLFKRLCEAHPQTVVRLEYQYRMSAAIQRLANTLIYDGHLRCGSLQVARQTIHYATDPSAAVQRWPFECARPPGVWDMRWAEQALDPCRGAVFVDTDAIPGREHRADGADSAQNDTEVRIVRALTALLRACGVDDRQIGVLSPYRAQLRQLEIAHGIASPDADTDADDDSSSSDSPRATSRCRVEMHTVDRYQGRDADVIIISWVRSNSSQAIGELLRDWRRINVAITRARTKLIMVGSQSTLARSPLLAGMLRILRADNAVVAMPANAVIPGPAADRPAACRTGGPPRAHAGAALLNGRPITSNIVAEQHGSGAYSR
ncbi:DNA replication endonuclease-helicase Dna2 [Coemansia spiralis]|nr:DNA replication endonuclease-helicase Dna2 [Coemansia spiralis]